jgi:hypothetical protein
VKLSGFSLNELREALEEAHRAEESARRAFARSTAARARILRAQADGRLPNPDDLQALAAYYQQAHLAAQRGMRFIEMSGQEIVLPPGDQPRKAKKESIEVMKVALRVLISCNQKTGASAADLDELVSFAPDLKELPSDELACEVIQRAMKRQVHMQRALTTGSY